MSNAPSCLLGLLHGGNTFHSVLMVGSHRGVRCLLYLASGSQFDYRGILASYMAFVSWHVAYFCFLGRPVPLFVRSLRDFLSQIVPCLSSCLLSAWTLALSSFGCACGLVVQTTFGCFCSFGLVTQATSGYFWCLGLVRDFV